MQHLYVYAFSVSVVLFYRNLSITDVWNLPTSIDVVLHHTYVLPVSESFPTAAHYKYRKLRKKCSDI